MAGEHRSEVSRRVALAIRKSGRTQREVAAALGVTPQALSRWLAGARRWKLSHLQQIAVYLEIEPQELVGGGPTSAPDAGTQFSIFVLAGVPAAEAYDLAMGDATLLSAEARARLTEQDDLIRRTLRSGGVLIWRPARPGENPGLLLPVAASEGG